MAPRPSLRIAPGLVGRPVRRFAHRFVLCALAAALTAGVALADHDTAPAEPPRVAVEPAGPSIGPADAPVTIVEFSDFECPFCAALQPTLERVKAEYAGRMRLVFRHFPLTGIHPNAWRAAEAAACAGEQGRFWDLHALMFSEQAALSAGDLREKAARLGMDTAAFGACLDDRRYHDAVHADVDAGIEAGVEGTPTLFINGRPVVGVVPFDELAALIDDELRRR